VLNKLSKLKIELKDEDYYPIAAFFGFFVGLLLFIFYSPNYYSVSEPVSINVQRGATLTQIIDSLYDKGVIQSKSPLKIAAFISGAEKKIKTGRYQFPNGLNYFDIVDLLMEGVAEEQTLVTIPEGIWQHDLAKLLEDDLGISAKEFMDLSKNKTFLMNLGISCGNLEGYLLPETYYFYKSTTTKEVIVKLKSEMDALFDSAATAQMAKLKMDKHDILTIASIIDGESNVIQEFKRISGVYHNRLKKGMLLQADPTIQYLIRERKRHNKVYFKDLEIKSPYNTYMYAGLPPGPINNPGKDAVEAALYPEEHDYYFFVASGKGDHVFAKTNAQHNLNVEKYRQWRSKNRN